MNIHRIYYPVMALGPGERIGIWTRGCRRRCPGCMSPELWEKAPDKEIPMAELKKRLQEMLDECFVEGVTISGGEPLEQEAELMELLEFLRARGVRDILLYTGLTRKQLGARARKLTKYATVVCGPYIREEDDGRALRGSSNQEFLFRSPEMQEQYEPWTYGPRLVQPVDEDDEMFLVGLVDPDAGERVLSGE
ncbi:MAG: 4Fe-4S cluster-binding domain-containing protein [Clostridia bacterium]|nr:4Fe-4S cluster-binding domain-containing protein [Clostridia bacterium]